MLSRAPWVPCKRDADGGYMTEGAERHGLSGGIGCAALSCVSLVAVHSTATPRLMYFKAQARPRSSLEHARQRGLGQWCRAAEVFATRNPAVFAQRSTVGEADDPSHWCCLWRAFKTVDIHKGCPDNHARACPTPMTGI